MGLPAVKAHQTQDSTWSYIASAGTMVLNGSRGQFAFPNSQIDFPRWSNREADKGSSPMLFTGDGGGRWEQTGSFRLQGWCYH